MQLWQIEELLADLKTFENPNIFWEQYTTPPHIAAFLVQIAENSFGDLKGKLVADLGCGTGMLCAAMHYFGANSIVGIDVDESALAIAKVNTIQCGLPVELLQSNITELPFNSAVFDTVVMNPPFGTRRKGIDVVFLEKAIEIVYPGGSIYSLHKTCTRSYLYRKILQRKCEGEVLGKFIFNLSKTFAFHRMESMDIEVDLWRLKRKK
ncbi:Methyltransferase-like protein 5 [Galdieria sulphuraria]|uniref:Methyltransferase-like protein 5 n=1 Tax=Galdieria sulphuraria TaxID=130081 RepID=M2Y222_GALSU|nr:methylase-like protein [Galdieria sulphuraria]EME30018.1 methylase-like protein [Galdieria sulphuraria]GJD06231.1 Methyltransferase-like protein 5 [Galdieria sulphuraria]|eukprot:XP_005706538.1 methylase-like protein [Galdieria sulphuraria]